MSVTVKRMETIVKIVRIPSGAYSLCCRTATCNRTRLRFRSHVGCETRRRERLRRDGNQVPVHDRRNPAPVRPKGSMMPALYRPSNMYDTTVTAYEPDMKCRFVGYGGDIPEYAEGATGVVLYLNRNGYPVVRTDPIPGWSRRRFTDRYGNARRINDDGTLVRPNGFVG